MISLKYKLTVFFCTVAMIFSSCSDFLDVVPENDIATIKSSFEKRETALKFYYGCWRSYPINGFAPLDPGMFCGSELTAGSALRNPGVSHENFVTPFRITSGQQNVAAPYLDNWSIGRDYYTGIRNCNTFISHVDEVYNMSQQEKNLYKGGAKAMKAYYYFQLMKQYGPITLMPVNIDVEAPIEEMQIPRSPIDTCVKAITDLLDEAIELGLYTFSMQPSSEYGLPNADIVYAWKAQVLLWAASPLFNGNQMFSSMKNREGVRLFPERDPEKWKKAAEAADEAVAFCETQGKKLYNTYTQESSPLLVTMRNIQFACLPIQFQSDELIFGLYSHQAGDIALRLPRYKGLSDKDDTPPSQMVGSANPTIEVVEKFYTAHGLPIENDKSWDYNNRYAMGVETDFRYQNVVVLNSEVLNLHLRREPRFYANIAFDGGIWRVGGEYQTMEPYKGGLNGWHSDRLTNRDYVNATGYWAKKFIHPTLNGSKFSKLAVHPSSPFPIIRMAELYLMQAEAWNEVEGVSEADLEEKVYAPLNKVRERAGIPTVQDSWKIYSNIPEKLASQDGRREVIRQERQIELAFEGQYYWDMKRWMEAHKEFSKNYRGWNILGAQGSEFYNGFQGPIDVVKDNIFEAPRDYFWPLSSLEVLNSNVVQNLGW